MTDVMTNEPLRVLVEGTSKPFIEFPFAQLEAIQRVLDSHEIAYEVEENVTSYNGGPEIATINFGWDADICSIQAILDNVH